MSDEDVERALGRYRPLGPTPFLRQRVLSAGVAPARVVGPPAEPRRWPWLLAAATTIALAIAGHTRASVLHDASAAQVLDSFAREREARVRELSDLLGGGEAARRQAIALVDGWSAGTDAAPAPAGGSR